MDDLSRRMNQGITDFSHIANFANASSSMDAYNAARQSQNEWDLLKQAEQKRQADRQYMSTRTFDDRGGGLGGLLAGFGNMIVDPARQAIGAAKGFTDTIGDIGGNIGMRMALGDRYNELAPKMQQAMNDNKLNRSVADMFATIDNSQGGNRDVFMSNQINPFARWDKNQGGRDIVSDLGAIGETALLAAPVGAAKAASLPARMLAMGGVGAGFGAADTLRQSGQNTNLGELLGNTAMGGAFGAAFPAVGRVVSKGLGGNPITRVGRQNMANAWASRGKLGRAGMIGTGAGLGIGGVSLANLMMSPGAQQPIDYGYGDMAMNDPYAGLTDEQLYQLAYGGGY